MSTTRRTLALLLVGASLASAGCVQRLGTPPLLMPEMPTGTIIPNSMKFRIAIFNFVDQTEMAGPLNEAIPDALSTMLFKSGRFDIMDRGQLREIAAPDYQKYYASFRTAHAVDAILDGSITSINRNTATIDLRLVNLQSGTVMYATTAAVGFSAGNEVDLVRNDIKTLTQDLVAAFPNPRDLKRGQILSRDDVVVTINMGKLDKVVPGLTAFVVSYGDRTIDPASGQLLGEESYLGEVYILAVFDRTAKGIIYRGANNVRVNNYVLFK